MDDRQHGDEMQLSGGLFAPVLREFRDRARLSQSRLAEAAGFMPGRIESLLAGEPVLSEALGLLQNRAIPAEVRDDVRNMIALLVRQAQRSAFTNGRVTARDTVVAA